MNAVVLIPPSKHAKNVARDLVYGCWCKGKRIAGIQFPPVSQLIVVTALIKYGHKCDLLDAA
ncbi:MAG: B12-binding domain-containing radical SAM protein, partial [Vampirovibrionia bacterium]